MTEKSESGLLAVIIAIIAAVIAIVYFALKAKASNGNDDNNFNNPCDNTASTDYMTISRMTPGDLRITFYNQSTNSIYDGVFSESMFPYYLNTWLAWGDITEIQYDCANDLLAVI